ESSRFIGNVSWEGGGGLCISDPEGLRADDDSDILLICNTDFISNEAKNEDGVTNTSNKGGAVYNRIGAETIMVNCVIAGNFSEEEGGGTCNAEFVTNTNTETRLDMHNCLLVGNWCKTNTTGDKDVGGGHFNRDDGQSELVNCTLIDNYADFKYGGVANRDTNSVLLLRNSIVYDNTDGHSQTGVAEEVNYDGDNLHDENVDNNVIGEVGDEFVVEGGQSEVNTSNDPGFADGLSGLSWSTGIYDPDTGTTAFSGLSGLPAGLGGMLFKPKSSGGHEYLLIISNTATSIDCWGKTAESNETGLVFNPFLCVAPGCNLVHAAEDFGDSGHLPDDFCDIDDDDNKAEALPWDLYENPRNQGNAPDSGVSEVDPG
ncbi:MAG: hypothetical protein IID33_01115, partial [Planctomycetes bacterium]|nr:hypothetical protein [Planctomycetota bacterium]